MTELEELAPADSKAILKLFGEYDPEGELIIRDPYYDRGTQGFDKVRFGLSVVDLSPIESFRFMSNAFDARMGYLIPNRFIFLT